MTKEFIPYEQALALKELGFDEPCFGRFYTKPKCKMFSVDEKGRHYQIKNTPKKLYTVGEDFVLNDDNAIIAPTFSQVFRWFREKHNLMHMIWIGKFTDRIPFYGYDLVLVTNLDYEIEDDGIPSDYKTYEDAEFACLIRLIDMIKTK